jgi:hypothetical protein
MLRKHKQGTRNGKSQEKQSRKRSRQAHRALEVLVGQPWNEPLQVTVNGDREDCQRAKDWANKFLTVTFVLLLGSLTGYAMATGDQSTLHDVLQITRYGLLFVALWAGGKAALKVMSGWKNTEW